MKQSESMIPKSSELRERDARLRALQRLAGRLAHDFNNYLSPIFGYLSLIKEETKPESPAHQYAQTMERGVRRVTRLLETILLAARPERRFMARPNQLDRLIERKTGEWQTGFPDWVRIAVRLELAPCEIVLDEVLWEEALSQLLANARFALSHGGELVISLSPKTLAPREAEELGVQSGPGFELVVQDNGPGMSDELLLHALDPFFSTRPKNLAPGLGLSVLYGVARMHGGQVTLHRLEGGGTRVQIWIPSVDEDLGASPAFPPPLNPLLNPLAKILMVEPDAFATETASSALQKLRYQVQVATDGAAALQAFERNPASFSLALINTHIEGPSGWELAARLRKHMPELPLILMNGHKPEERTAPPVELGSPLVIMQRPFRVAELVAQARAFLPAAP